MHLIGGYPVEPVDVHPNIRHLECAARLLTLTDKAVPLPTRWAGAGSATGSRCAGSRRGIDREQLEREPSLMTVINTSSPLRLDSPMAAGIIEMSAAPARS